VKEITNSITCRTDRVFGPLIDTINPEIVHIEKNPIEATSLVFIKYIIGITAVAVDILINAICNFLSFIYSQRPALSSYIQNNNSNIN
jgi:hypothetical protein